MRIVRLHLAPGLPDPLPLQGLRAGEPRVADDAQVPVVILIDWNHHKILLEDVHLPGPALHLVVPPLQKRRKARKRRREAKYYIFLQSPLAGGGDGTMIRKREV
jgi:hypothetical protein